MGYGMGYDNGREIAERMKRRSDFRGKSVFQSDQVIHVWANQSQPHARNAKATIWFEGTSLFSYQTMIARIATDIRGERVALISSEKFSVTTSGQQHSARLATRHMRVMLVPDVENLPRSVDRLIEDAKRSIALAANTRKRPATRVAAIATARAEFAEALSLIDTFGLTIARPVWDTAWDGDLAAIAEKHAAAIAAEVERIRALKEADAARLQTAWYDLSALFLRTGHRENDITFPWGRFPCLLAIKGDTIRTSWGAEFPVAHGIRALRLICAARKAGREWKRDGAGPRLGHFQVDSVTADGTVHAGCHTVEWSAIEHAAKALGLTA